jgi:peptide deformylase
MITLIQKGDPILRQVAPEVPHEDISKPYIQDTIKRMKAVLAQEDDAVAVAAPQIGESLRIFVVSGKVFSEHYPDLEEGDAIPPDLVCINPRLTKVSKKKESMTEGCLSVRWIYGTTTRAIKASIEALDERGKPFSRGGAGLIAQIFQHETDHLNGVLFVDSARDLEHSPPEARQEKEAEREPRLSEKLTGDQ